MLLLEILLLSLILCISPTVFAGIYFSPITAPDVYVSIASPEWVDYQFSARFEPRCTSGCTGTQDYQLGFSDEGISGDKAAPSSLIVKELKKVMQLSVTFTGGGSNGTKAFELGGWSEHIDPIETSVIATFNLRLNKNKLMELADNQDKVVFYLVGEDVESTRYFDSEKVEIYVQRQKEVKISGLHDVTLSEEAKSAKIKACVYSSTGYVSFQFSGSHSKRNETFKLADQKDVPTTVPYKLKMKTKEDNSFKEIEYDGFGEGDKWEVNRTHVDCSNQNDFNTTFKVKVTNKNIKDLTAGIYTDTMTITVMPR